MGSFLSCFSDSPAENPEAADRFFYSIPHPYHIDSVEHMTHRGLEEKTIIFSGYKELDEYEDDEDEEENNKEKEEEISPDNNNKNNNKTNNKTDNNNNNNKKERKKKRIPIAIKGFHCPNRKEVQEQLSDLVPLFLREILFTKFFTFLRNHPQHADAAKHFMTMLEAVWWPDNELLSTEDRKKFSLSSDNDNDDDDENKNNNNNDNSSENKSNVKKNKKNKNKNKQSRCNSFFLGIVIPLMDIGDLQSEVTENYRDEYPVLSDDREHVAKTFIAQVLCGLRSFHRFGCSHRDIKTSNVFLFNGLPEANWKELIEKHYPTDKKKKKKTNSEKEEEEEEETTNSATTSGEKHEHQQPPVAIVGDYGLSRLLWSPSFDSPTMRKFLKVGEKKDTATTVSSSSDNNVVVDYETAGREFWTENYYSEDRRRFHHHEQHQRRGFYKFLHSNTATATTTTTEEEEKEEKEEETATTTTTSPSSSACRKGDGTQPCRGECCPLTDFVGTRWYRSPEFLFADFYYTTTVDIWGVGLILYELVAGGRKLFKYLRTFVMDDDAETHPQFFEAIMDKLEVRPTDELVKSLSPEEVVMTGFQEVLDKAKQNKHFQVQDLLFPPRTGENKKKKKKKNSEQEKEEENKKEQEEEKETADSSASDMDMMMNPSKEFLLSKMIKYDWKKISEGCEISDECQEVLNAMLQIDPKQRLTCEQLLQLPFFKDVEVPVKIVEGNDKSFVDFDDVPHLLKEMCRQELFSSTSSSGNGNEEEEDDSSDSENDEDNNLEQVQEQTTTTKTSKKLTKEEKRKLKEQWADELGAKAYSMFCGCRDPEYAWEFIFESGMVKRI